jgi:thiol-disulfide isomerase/thioredoxin
MISRFLIRIILFTICSNLAISAICREGHEIKIHVNGTSDTALILGYYLNKNLYPVDTVYTDSCGNGTFSGEKPLPQGMYFIYLPTGRLFQFLLGKDQMFFIAADTSDFVNKTIVKGSRDNEIFFDFQKLLSEKQRKIKELQLKAGKTKNIRKKKKIEQKIDSLNIQIRQMTLKLSKNNPDLFVSKLILATLNLSAGEQLSAEYGNINSSGHSDYYRNRYFDHFDPFDVRLLRTPLYGDKIRYYLKNIVPQNPDTLIKEVDFLIEGARADSMLFQYLVVVLYNFFRNSDIMGMDAVQVHIAEEYYLKDAWWEKEKYLNTIKNHIRKLKPLLIGQPAPDVELMVLPREHILTALNDSILKAYPHAGELKKLYAVNAEFLVLFFWNADCNDCREILPSLYTLYKKELACRNVEVIAVSTAFSDEGKVKWIDQINLHKTYDWINAWNPYDYSFMTVYDIRSTPMIYILNRNKEIIAKRLAPEHITEYLRIYNEQNH